jgi:hypothetical protein
LGKALIALVINKIIHSDLLKDRIETNKKREREREKLLFQQKILKTVDVNNAVILT